MPVPPHIRRIVVIAVVGCAMLAGLSSAASARPLYDRNLDTTSTAEPSSPPRERGDTTLLFALGGAVVLLVVGTVGYSYRVRASRRVTA